MGAVSVVTRERSWFGDVHRRTRTLRLTPHPAERVVTLSLWEGQVCQGTIRLADTEVPALIGALAEGLASSAGYVAPPPAPSRPGHAEVIALPTAAEDRVSSWMHGPPTVPPSPADVVATAMTKALSVVGRSARAVADKLAPEDRRP